MNLATLHYNGEENIMLQDDKHMVEAEVEELAYKDKGQSLIIQCMMYT